MGTALSTQTSTTIHGVGSFDPKKMSDQDIKLHCAQSFADDPTRMAACVDGIVNMRGQEACKTVNGITTCTKIVATEIASMAPTRGAQDLAKTPVETECRNMFPNDPTAFKPCVAAMYNCKESFPNADAATFKQCFQGEMLKLKGSTQATAQEAVKGATIGGVGVATVQEAVKGSTISGTIGGVGVASGYCSEGSLCGTPMYGRPLWVWILILLVIFLALQGLKGR